VRDLATATTAVAAVTLIAAAVIRVGRRHDTVGYPWPPETWVRALVIAGAVAGVVTLLAWWYVAAV